jgi:hypothetical protein
MSRISILALERADDSIFQRKLSIHFGPYSQKMKVFELNSQDLLNLRPGSPKDTCATCNDGLKHRTFQGDRLKYWNLTDNRTSRIGRRYMDSNCRIEYSVDLWRSSRLYGAIRIQFVDLPSIMNAEHQS